ncbi:response regulator transcription factor [Salinibacterium sp.]|uniref:response regulator transcription factor n=1 Tax=Salinibacterium sp. TaxID=1915057 RepID=UPI00286CB73C|nr:response regulator transcription factor [Salinibacterium sp.]
MVVGPDTERRDETLDALAQCAQVTVIATVPLDVAALGAIEIHDPDVVVLGLCGEHRGTDILDGVGVDDTTAVVVLDSFPTEEQIRQVATCGVDGYLVEGQFSPEDLVAAIVLAPTEGSTISPRVAAVLLSDYAGCARRSKEERAAVGLTPREHQVMELIASGISNSEIAQRLTLSMQSVKNKVGRILAKLGVSSRAEAASWWAGYRPADTRSLQQNPRR